MFGAIAGWGWLGNVPAGGACPAPTNGGLFAAIAEQSGQAMCRGPDSPQGCPAIRPLRIRGSSWPSRNRAARQCSCGRGVPRPYERGTVCGHLGMGGSGARLVGRKKREAPGWGLSVIGSWGRGARVPGRFVCGALPGKKNIVSTSFFCGRGIPCPNGQGRSARAAGLIFCWAPAGPCRPYRGAALRGW